MQPDLTMTTIRAGASRLDLAPRYGGTVLNWYTEAGGRRLDWFRPTNATPNSPGETACFPLVPFSNRVRDRRFTFQGRAVELPKVERYGAHFRHGFGCLASWDVVLHDANRAVIEHRETGASWPFPYLAQQDFVLTEGGLSHRFTIGNTGTEAMPCGFGIHPYFPRTPKSRVEARVKGLWIADHEVMPVRLEIPPPRDQDPASGIAPATQAVDNVYMGWDRKAQIDWPDRGASLTMTADDPLDVLIVFTPPGKDFFCVEPVSNITDAFNFAAQGRTDTGTIVLEPGQSVSAVVTMTTTLV